MVVRLVKDADREALVGFLGEVPESDRNFFKQDISDPDIVEWWLRDARGLRLVAHVGREVVGTVALIKRIGWSEHVGEIELIVSPSHRGRGLGRRLAVRILSEAVRAGLTHIVVEVAAEQEALVAMFRRLGFEPEALLRDFVRDRRGEHHDLLVLTHRVNETWSELLTFGIDSIDELGSPR
jgi:ribosomal protein S18 acetylase RimI-like enzyme